MPPTALPPAPLPHRQRRFSLLASAGHPLLLFLFAAAATVSSATAAAPTPHATCADAPCGGGQTCQDAVGQPFAFFCVCNANPAVRGDGRPAAPCAAGGGPVPVPPAGGGGGASHATCADAPCGSGQTCQDAPGQPFVFYCVCNSNPALRGEGRPVAAGGCANAACSAAPCGGGQTCEVAPAGLPFAYYC
eukprot:Rhum_TRINITY_DN10486_c0_g1::Rhum_TRINITY_DN10486_c0_g1_i1::g.38635::m.38635